MSKAMKPTTCNVPGCEHGRAVMLHQATGIWACEACRKYYARHGKFGRERRRQRRGVLVGPCDNQCGFSGQLSRIIPLNVNVCPRCASYYARNGYLPYLTDDAMHRAMKRSTCACGKPASVAIDMHGAAVVDWRSRNFSVQSWVEYVCADCAHIEDQLRNWQPPNEYRPGALIARE